MGWVGKTTLAVHLANRHAPELPAAQYFTDLAGCTAGAAPISAWQVLNTLLRQAGVSPELIPPHLDARAALWRARLAGHRALLVLDNALDVAQVRPLPPASPGTLTLISTRRRTTSLEGAVSVPLDVLVDYLTRSVQVWASPLMNPTFRVEVTVETEPRDPQRFRSIRVHANSRCGIHERECRPPGRASRGAAHPGMADRLPPHLIPFEDRIRTGRRGPG
jgi:hypothetical protein